MITDDSAVQKRILNQSRQYSSLYTMNLGAFNVVGGTKPPLWNEQSDRTKPGVVKRHVPRHGNSSKTSITRCRPGSTSARGAGVDIKHGSYARYLAKLKGKTLSTTNKTVGTPKQGNKTQNYNLLSDSNCGCNNNN
tara:strand:- start:5480 stop:5887 length:408 start_codon:yes stop_codon:yes gene_type:complete